MFGSRIRCLCVTLELEKHVCHECPRFTTLTHDKRLSKRLVGSLKEAVFVSCVPLLQNVGNGGVGC